MIFIAFFINLLIHLTLATPSVLLSCPSDIVIPPLADIWFHTKQITHIHVEKQDSVGLIALGCSVLREDTLPFQGVDHDIATQFDKLEDFHQSYHDGEEIMLFMQRLVGLNPKVSVQFMPDINNKTSTVQGRTMPGLIITSKVQQVKPKEQVYVVCNQHAREWITNAACLFTAHALVATYNSSDASHIFAVNNAKMWWNLLDRAEIHIIPLANPDGLAITRTTGRRMVRKNANDVDMNRNWPAGWGNDDGSSPYSWSETYRGASAASEPETRALIEYITCRLRPTPAGFGLLGFDVHSYGQLIMREWGMDVPRSDDAFLDSSIGVPMSDAMWAANPGNEAYYTSTNSVGLYPVSGSASDFFAVASGKSWAIELRDTSYHGFLLPASEIVATGRELWMGIGKAVEWRLNGSGGKGVYWRVPQPWGASYSRPVCSLRSSTSRKSTSSTSSTTSSTKKITSSTKKTTSSIKKSTNSTKKTTSSTKKTTSSMRKTTSSTTKTTSTTSSKRLSSTKRTTTSTKRTTLSTKNRRRY